MIARVRIPLPVALHVPANVVLAPIPFAPRTYERIELHRILRADVSKANATLDPVPEQATPSVAVDGQPTVAANVLEFNFHARDFDRTIGAPTPPMVSVAIECSNSFLRRVRALSRFSAIRDIKPEGAWVIRYLNDDFSDLEPDPAQKLVRSNFALSASVGPLCVLSEELWMMTNGLGESFQPAVFEALLTDAAGLLPQIGPAIVLTATAIEVCATTTLDRFVRLNPSLVPEPLWDWINNRTPHDRQPHTDEELDAVMKALCKRSLKERPELWRAFQAIRSARNKFAHEGIALDNDTKKPMTLERATALVSQSRSIVDWIEEALPEIERRVRLSDTARQVTQTLNIGPIE